MFLSMNIIADHLQTLSPECHILSDNMDILTTRFYSPDLPLSPHIVYIGREDDILHNHGNRIALINNEDWLLLQTDDMNFVANQLLILLEEISEWNNKLLELSATSSLTQDLLDQSVSLIKRPIFLLDSAQHILAISKNYPKGTVDYIWDEMLERGTANIEFILSAHDKTALRDLTEQINYYSNDIFPYPIYQRNFFINQELVGQMCMIDMNNNITKGELHLFNLLCEKIDHWFHANVQVTEYVKLQIALQNAVSYPDTDNHELRRHLQLRHWQESDELVLIKLDACSSSHNINELLCKSLLTQFNYTEATCIGYSICMLCNITLSPLDTSIKKLEDILENSKYYGIFSEHFTMKDSFFAPYEKILIASNYCERTPGKLHNGSQLSHYYMFHKLQGLFPRELIHPALNILKSYDSEHHSDLYNTLKVYLECERSPVATAKVLQLHRNSLSYRLDKINDLIQVDLDEAMIRLYIILSFMIDSNQN